MTDKQTAKLLLERWFINVKSGDRRHTNMPTIFDDIVSRLFTAGVEFDTAYETLKQASKMMYPSVEIVKRVYKGSFYQKTKDIKEFTKSWQESIDKAALTSFYQYFDIQGEENNRALPPKKKKDEQGGMVTEDELNEEDFWKSAKSVSKTKPWLFDDEDQAQ